MKLQMKTCVRCERLFASLQSEVCTACEAEEEADFLRIREALRKNPGLNVEQVSEAAEVEPACVLRMLGQGRIENVALGNPVKCGQCGAPALSVSKRLCQACLTKLDMQCTEAIRDIRTRIRPKKTEESDVNRVRKAVDEKRQLRENSGSRAERKRPKWMEPDLPR